MDGTAQKFVDFAADLTYSRLTPQAIHAAKRSVIDSIGCAFGAFHTQPAKAIRNFASRITASKPSTIIGTQIRTSPEMAAFVNGGMIRYLDFSDDYFGGSGEMGPHPSDNVGAVLAA